MVIKIEGNCQYPGCNNKATCIAYGRSEKEPKLYCDAHAEVVCDQQAPEYVVNCPNCGCSFGVN